MQFLVLGTKRDITCFSLLLLFYASFAVVLVVKEEEFTHGIRENANGNNSNKAFLLIPKISWALH